MPSREASPHHQREPDRARSPERHPQRDVPGRPHPARSSPDPREMRTDRRPWQLVRAPPSHRPQGRRRSRSTPHRDSLAIARQPRERNRRQSESRTPNRFDPRAGQPRTDEPPCLDWERPQCKRRCSASPLRRESSPYAFHVARVPLVEQDVQRPGSDALLAQCVIHDQLTAPPQLVSQAKPGMGPRLARAAARGGLDRHARGARV